jgi:hypothetical protein
MTNIRLLGCVLTFALSVGAVMAVKPAAAQTAPLGYQCFSTVSQVQYCSCQAFTDLDSASAWVTQTLNTLSASGLSGDDVTMAGHSDQLTDQQSTPCS